MFPIPWNFPFRKKDGSLSTISAEMGGVLPPATTSKLGGVKVGSGLSVTSDGTLTNPSELPEHTSATAGKVLGVDDEGLLEWGELPASGTKIYYKNWEKNILSDAVIAKFSDSTASSSGIHIARFDPSYSGNDINVNGYIPISAIAIDSATGYSYMVGIQQMGNTAQSGYQVTFAIGNREITKTGCKVRVFYIKNDDMEQLT